MAMEAVETSFLTGPWWVRTGPVNGPTYAIQSRRSCLEERAVDLRKLDGDHRPLEVLALVKVRVAGGECQRRDIGTRINTKLISMLSYKCSICPIVPILLMITDSPLCDSGHAISPTALSSREVVRGE